MKTLNFRLTPIADAVRILCHMIRYDPQMLGFYAYLEELDHFRKACGHDPL